jgi:hypothetical protein
MAANSILLLKGIFSQQNRNQSENLLQPAGWAVFVSSLVSLVWDEVISENLLVLDIFNRVILYSLVFYLPVDRFSGTTFRGRTRRGSAPLWKPFLIRLAGSWWIWFDWNKNGNEKW